MGFSGDIRGGETLLPGLAEPCEPGQILTEAALSVGFRVDSGGSVLSPLFAAPKLETNGVAEVVRLPTRMVLASVMLLAEV